jgi:hypothetical protein
VYDQAGAAQVVARALGLAGGADLLLGSLASLPGVQHWAAQRSMFRSSPERVLVGEWRYEVAADGRLLAAHVVGGIVLAELALPPDAAGVHVAAAIGQHIAAYGAQTVPAVESMLEGLAVAAGQ